MTVRFRTPKLAPVLLSCALGVAAFPDVELGGLTIAGGSALAQAATAPKLPGCKTPPEKRRLKALSQSFFKKVAPIDELTNPAEDKKGKAPEPNFQAAWPMLKKLVDRCDDCNEYEYAQLYQRAGFLRYSLDDAKGAIEYFQKTVKQSPHIPEALETQLLFQIAQLLTSEERYKESLDYFARWEAMCPTNVPDDYYYYRAQIFYQLDDKANALKEITRGINIVEGKGAIAKEPWYKLQFAIYVDNEDYKNGEQVAEKLAVNYTDARILTQLASVYGMNGKEDRQRGLMDALDAAGALDREADYRNLAYLYMSAEVPFLAAKVMQRGVDSKKVPRDARNLETWGVALTQALESKKATPIMEEAAKKANDGKIYATLAAVYLDSDEHNKAIAAAREALKKGGLRSEGEMHLYMGTAFMYMEKFDDSLKALRQATKDERYKKYADDLIRYVSKEKERQQELAKAQASATS